MYSELEESRDMLIAKEFIELIKLARLRVKFRKCRFLYKEKPHKTMYSAIETVLVHKAKSAISR